MSPSFAPSDALLASLTVETLLFAVLTVSLTLVGAGDRYVPKFIVKGHLTLAVALAITAVALAAGASWWEIFQSSSWPDGLRPMLEEWGLAVGVIVQPALGLIVWFVIRGNSG
jgi:hypothetical protein